MRGPRAVDLMTLTQTDAYPAACIARGRGSGFYAGERRS